MVCMFGKTPKVFTISEKKDWKGNTKNFWPKKVPEDPNGYSDLWCFANMKNLSKGSRCFESKGISLFSIEEIKKFYDEAQEDPQNPQNVPASKINEAIDEKVAAAAIANDREDKGKCALLTVCIPCWFAFLYGVASIIMK